ncbi:MAG: extracellular solute-binding protein, partial [Trueperaceae bacterium]|nr:extracellular solute-binding protein [Trueperaceae bacterium]
MNRLRVIVLSLVLLSVAASAQAQRTLEIYITGLTEGTMQWFQDVAFPGFQATHPDVQLEILTGGWGDFDAAVAGWITTGSGPDIVYLGSEYAAAFGHLLADLDPYLADWDELGSFLPAALAVASWEGHLRGLPLLMSPRPMFFRADLAADASAIPPLTFADSLAFVRANSAVADGAMTQMGFMDIGAGLFDAQEFIAYIWSAGGELYNADGSSAFDSAATAEALKFMYDRRRAVLPTETTAGLPPIEGWPIGSGMVVSGIFPMWNMPPTDNALWNDIVIGPYPAGPNGS